MCLPVCWFFSFSSFERETKNTLRCRIENIFSLWSLGSASPFTATSIVPVVTGPSAKDHGHSWTSRFKETLVTFTTLLDPYSLQLSRQEAQGRKKSAETFYCKTVTWAQLVAFHSSYFTTNSIWCGDAVFSLGRGGEWLLWCLKCTNEPRHLLWCMKTLLSVQVQLCTVLSRTKLGFSVRQWLLPHNQGKNLALSSS